MNILHINPQLETIGGMERYMEFFYRAFKKKHNQFFFKFFFGKSNVSIPKDKIHSLDFEGKTILQKTSLVFKSPFYLSTYAKEKHIQYSISHGDLANFINILSKFFGNPAEIVVIFHNSTDHKLIGWLLYIAISFFARFSDTIITVSKELEINLVEKLFLKKSSIQTIYNPFDFDLINLLSNEKIDSDIETILNNKKINFCNIARLEEYKKQDWLIDRFDDYQKIYQNGQLFFIGDGNYKQVLMAKVAELRLNNSVYFLGYKENIYGYIKKMHAHCYCSGLQEGFGRTLVDTLGCGIPVLTHDYKFGAKEIMRGSNQLQTCTEIEILDNGILTPYMDKEKYIEGMAIISKMKFEKEKINLHIAQYNVENFKNSWDKVLV